MTLTIVGPSAANAARPRGGTPRAAPRGSPPVEPPRHPFVVAHAERHPGGTPAAVVHDDGHDRHAETGRRVELHRVEAERAVAHHPHHLRPDRPRGGERVTDAVADVPRLPMHGARPARPGTWRWPRACWSLGRPRSSRRGESRLDFGAEAHRVDRGCVGPRAWPARAIAAAVRRRPAASRRSRSGGWRRELAERRAGVGGDADADRDPVAADLARLDVDLHEVVAGAGSGRNRRSSRAACRRRAARRPGTRRSASPGPKQCGWSSGRVPRPAWRVTTGMPPARRRRGVLAGARPPHAAPATTAGRAARIQQSSPPGDELGAARPCARGEQAGETFDVGVVDRGVNEVDRYLEVHRPRAAGPSFAEGEGDVLGDAVEMVDAPRPLRHRRATSS